MLWEEKVLPILILEVVSHKYGGEYDDKLELYQTLGILYYVIYNPLTGRRGKYKSRQSLEVYKLIDAEYEVLESVSVIQENSMDARNRTRHRMRGNWEREWAYWYDRNCVRYPTDDERVQMAEVTILRERLEKQQERQQKEKLAAYLRSLGINPDQI